MHIKNSDITKRMNNLNSKYVKSEFNLNSMNPTANGNYSSKTASYIINNWRSFNENSNIAFDKALDIFDIVCENGSIEEINTLSKVLSEGIQKVRDASQLANSIKHKTSRFKSKISTKINSKMEKINNANNNLNEKIKQAYSTPTTPKPATPTNNQSNDTEETQEAKQEAALNAYTLFLNEANKVAECDRILRNYANISKRFDLQKMVNEMLEWNPDIEECIVSICECIDTYNSSFVSKYNTMLETSSYILSRAYIDYPNDKLIETVTDYHIFNIPMDESEIDGIKRVKHNSVLFEESDFSSIDYLINEVNENKNPTKQFSVTEAVNSYGTEDVVSEGVKDKVKEWIAGNPEERKDKEVEKLIDDFREQCKKGDSENNTTRLKSLVNKMFTKSPYQIVNGLPKIFGLIRLFFIAGTCAIHPIVALVGLITDKIIQNHLERKQLEKLINLYKSEIDKVKAKIEKSKSDEEKDRMEKYSDELKKDLDKLKEYERNLYSEEENDEREYSSYEYDDNDLDDDWDFGDSDWDLDDDDLKFSESQLTDLASIIYISELVENINEGLIDTNLDGIVYDNIFKFDNDTIDAIADFSITVPVILEKNKLCEAFKEYREELRKNNFMNNIMRIDCLNENIRKIESSAPSYNVTNNTKGLICTLNWINEMVTNTNCSTILEMNFSNTIKLAMNKLKKTATKLSDKEKKISNNIDVSMSSVSRGLEDALRNDNREAIIKGRILPSASKTIKIALACGAAWAVAPAVAVIGALGAFACSTKLKAKERQLVLDDIEIELKMCERYLKAAEDKNDMEAIRQIEITQRNLERQRQRIKYKMNVVYRQNVPDAGSEED